MKPHFMVADGGDLFDTRHIHWSHLAPLRKGFKTHAGQIETVAQLKATLRAGSYTGVGGYPLYLICDDGEALCFECARKNAAQIMPAIADKDRGGWRVVACDVNYESTIDCSNCNAPIPSAYGSDDES